jgi:hypothetical protein
VIPVLLEVLNTSGITQIIHSTINVHNHSHQQTKTSILTTYDISIVKVFTLRTVVPSLLLKDTVIRIWDMMIVTSTNSNKAMIATASHLIEAHNNISLYYKIIILWLEPISSAPYIVLVIGCSQLMKSIVLFQGTNTYIIVAIITPC